MSRISDEEAAQCFGISTRHERLENLNDERRFRLENKDGTAYIRTEASSTGGWQQSHYHQKVSEMYIVQSGWMALAEMQEGVLAITIYRAGQSVSTKPNIPHNVYLAASTVLHTVKYGRADGQDRRSNDETTVLDELTTSMSESELISASLTTPERQAPSAGPIRHYSEGYRHFDNLIWQVPAWSTAIFALTLAALGTAEDISSVLDNPRIGKSEIAGSISFLMGAFLLVLSHALYRFRVHQSLLVTKPTGRNILRSPHLWLLLIVTVQSLVLLWLAAPLFRISPSTGFALLMALGLAITVVRERKMIGIRNKGLPSR